MLPFLHERMRALEHLMAQSSAVLNKYTRLDLDLGPALTAFLDDTIAGYRALTRSSAENQMLVLKAQFISATQGVHPLTLERVTGHRREMVRAIALRVLQSSAEKLRNDLATDDQTIAEGRALLRPIVLLAEQKGLIPLRAGTALNQQELDELWRQLLQEADISLAARQVAMQLSLYDIQLLLAELISAIRGSH